MAAGYIIINYIPVPRVYLKYIPVVSFDVRCQSGIYIYIYIYISWICCMQDLCMYVCMYVFVYKLTN